MTLGKTCRFCTRCELIVVHQDELEHELTAALESRAPAVIGNEYMVLGMMDRKVWRRGLGDAATVTGDVRPHCGLQKRAGARVRSRRLVSRPGTRLVSSEGTGSWRPHR